MASSIKLKTRVICPECGAEILIPTAEYTTNGPVRVIGENSGLGTIVLPSANHPCGKPQSAMSQLASFAKSNPEMINLITQVMDEIEKGGYLEVDNIVRRWIPSQCLSMMQTGRGFHNNLENRGYDYSWRVLLADLARQVKHYKNDDLDGFRDRNRWYNKQLAYTMATHYIARLKDHISQLQPHSHKGRKYVKVGCWLNNYRGIHLDELPEFYGKLTEMAEAIKQAYTIEDVHVATFAFDRLRKQISWRKCEMCMEFINVYKAAGAYYTMKDLIMFEGCKMKIDDNGTPGKSHGYFNSHSQKFHFYGSDNRSYADMEDSLAALEIKAQNLVDAGVCEFGYQMLGLLREFLAYNQFNYDKAKQQWAEQSNFRKSLRERNKGNRRPRQ